MTMSTEWIKVEFYAQLPDGQTVTDLRHQDDLEVAANLMRAFGFQRIDGITAAVVEPQSSR